MRDYLTTAEVAAVLGVSPRRVQEMAAREKDPLRGERVGRAYLFPRREVERFARLPRVAGWPKGRPRKPPDAPAGKAKPARKRAG